MQGKIHNIDITILVDSGSVGTFICEQLAAQIPYKALEGVSAQYMTADGSPMTCSKTIIGLQWWTQSHTFISDVGILPLQCYDMIVGEDWLESCSPMWVHLQKKIMKITYAGNRITLKDLN